MPTCASPWPVIQASPFLKYKESVRGFVYDVQTGKLREVS